ncbi:MAG: hypothetical protein SGBAC_012165 [Bacillariaceae sp.]
MQNISSRRPEPRIVGGSNAQRNEFPYFVQMGLCGGALIAPGIVLSAAHCNEIFGIGVYVTVNPLGVKDAASRRLKIVERVFHPWYWDEWASYDFILVRLEEPIFFDSDSSIQVKLAVNQNDTFPADNTTLTTIGFGSLRSGSNRFPDILQKVELDVVNLDSCNRTLDYDVLDDSFICAGTQEGGRDSCQGDSGGPMVYIDPNDEDTHILVGLVSWGEGCGDPGIPGAYARVSKAVEWIEKVVCECWNVEGSPFCNDSKDDIIAEKRSSWNNLFTTTSTTNTSNTSNSSERNDAKDKRAFECPLFIDPNCQDTPGYVDYVGDVCAWHEERENPGCVDYGDSAGGPGFEGTNAQDHCCWCGGGSIDVGFDDDGTPTLPPQDFARDPECTDMMGWEDQHLDDCGWYEANTEEGTCSGWGTTRGGSGMREVTPDMACCHCGGGNYPTPAPSPMPSLAPSQSSMPSELIPMEPPTKSPAPSRDPQAPELDGPTTASNALNNNSSAAASWSISLGMLFLAKVVADIIIVL